MLVGFDDGEKVNKTLYTKQLNFNTKVAFDEHMRALLKELGYRVIYDNPSLACKDTKSEFRRSIHKPYIVVHPFGSSKKRSKEGAELVALVSSMRNIFPRHEIVITGSPEDKKTYAGSLNLLENEENVLNVVGQASTRELCSLIAQAELFVGVDTGITHLACFLNKESVVLAHHATMPTWLPYYNENATILYHVRGCPHDIYEGREHLLACCKEGFRCMDKIPQEQIEKVLTRKASSDS